MSNYTYETVSSKTVDKNSIKCLKLALIGAVSLFVPLTLGFSSNSSEKFNERVEVYAYRPLSESADTGTNFDATQLEGDELYPAASTYTNMGAEASLAKINNEYKCVNSLILQLKEDEENETFLASDYITNLYFQNEAMCVSVLKKAFSLEEYKYAPLVVDAIRLSEADFLQQWFKDLLIKGMQKQEHRIYMEEICELYEEELKTL